MDYLIDPQTNGPVKRASEEQLASISVAIKAGRASQKDGGELPARIDGAYLSHGGEWVYPDANGLPSLIVEERIELDEPV